MLKEEIPVETITRLIVFGGYAGGRWTPDLAILLTEIVFKQVLAIGIRLKIKNIKLFQKDYSNSEFNQALVEYQDKKSERETNLDESFDEKMDELEEDKVALTKGLMAKVEGEN